MVNCSSVLLDKFYNNNLMPGVVGNINEMLLLLQSLDLSKLSTS